MNRNRFLIDLPDADADALRADAKAEKLTVTAHIKRVLLLDSERRRMSAAIDPTTVKRPA